MDKGKSINILLTSAGRRGYLVKYFQEAIKGKGKVCAANSEGDSAALKAADEAVVTPLIHDASYISFLLQYCRKNKVTAVIPLFDIDLPVLSKHRKEFEQIGTRVLVSDPEVIDICNDKWKMYQFLAKNGFDVLPTFIYIQDALRAIRKGKAHFPFIIKPRWGMGSLSVYEAENEKELEILYEKARREVFNCYLKYESMTDRTNSILIQEKVQGWEYGLDNISDLKGNYCITVVKKKEGMRAGETDCATVVNIPELTEFGKRLAAAAKHIANMDIDLVISDDKKYVLDMNARFGGGYPFSHEAGVNLPLAIVKWLQGEEVPIKMLTPRTGATYKKDIRIIEVDHYDI